MNNYHHDQSLRRETEGKTSLIGFIGAPWTLAAYSVEAGHSKLCKKIKNMCLEDPKLAHKLLQKYTDNLCVYADYQVNKRIKKSIFRTFFCFVVIFHYFPLFFFCNFVNFAMFSCFSKWRYFQVNSGAQIFQIFESWAHHLTEDMFLEFAKVGRHFYPPRKPAFFSFLFFT